mgnify:CR=1 FL=1
MVMAMIARRWRRPAVRRPGSGFGARIGASMRERVVRALMMDRSGAGTLPDGGEVGTKLTI